MNIVSIIMVIFSLLAALDRIIGNKFGIGKEFEKGFMLLGTMTLSMAGMLIITPAIGELLKPLAVGFHELTGIDPSVIPASLLANDMGGEPLANQLAVNEAVGKFNAFIVSSMMGVIISFNIPFALGVVKKELHRELFLGILCGVATVPVGCFVSGLILAIPLPLLSFRRKQKSYRWEPFCCRKHGSVSRSAGAGSQFSHNRLYHPSGRCPAGNQTDGG